MRGAGQIAELVAIAEPDVGVIVNVGPVHLELLGTIENVAAAKAELIRDLRPGATGVVPAGEPLLEPHLRDDIETRHASARAATCSSLDFDDGRASSTPAASDRPRAPLHRAAQPAEHAGRGGRRDALGVEPAGPRRRRASPRCGARSSSSPAGVTVVNDCYNANPMSMRAALEHLAATPAERRVAVLGTMAELGPDARALPPRDRRAGRPARDRRADHGRRGGAADRGAASSGERYAAATPEEAGALLEELARPGDRVLVKGSRSVGLGASAGVAA